MFPNARTACYVAVHHESDPAMLRPLSARRAQPPAGALVDFAAPFADLGALRMRTFVPPALPSGAPLVVVLHGCTQTAAGYDHAAGWSRLAAAHGFALLFPEQVRANNANLCFNWFEPGDARRGSGEAASIAAATAAMVVRHRLDAARVFVTGLSAGGAMSNVMLAAYPDVFAGGAIMAGLPFGVARSVQEALGAMRSPPALPAAALGDRVRAASSYSGPWPRVSVWHGGADRTVVPANGGAVAAQWADVHGATADGAGRWRNAAGVTVVELTEIAGMSHGAPIDSRTGCVPAPFMLDVGIDASAHAAAFWGIAPAVAVARAPLRRSTAAPRRRELADVIAGALRAAGL